jgi:hypothetical protein
MVEWRQAMEEAHIGGEDCEFSIDLSCNDLKEKTRKDKEEEKNRYREEEYIMKEKTIKYKE